MERHSLLSQSEMVRYSRHLLLPEVGLTGQERLKRARILVIGAGGLGSPAIQYLAAAGIGTIGIVDFDTVDLSNLQRQVLYGTDDLNALKVERASRRVEEINPELKVEAHNLKLSEDNVMELLNRYDLAIDGTDNFSTRYLVNDACVLAGKPNVHGAIYRFEGQVSVFGFKGGPCYRCIFPEPPPPETVPNCAEGGVLGVMAGVVGSLQATEAIKIVLEQGNILSGRLLIYDALQAAFHTVKVKQQISCRLCGDSPTITKAEEIQIQCAASDLSSDTISPLELFQELQNGKNIVVLDVRTTEEVQICKIGGSRHIALSDLTERASELDKESDIVVYCKSGVRSAKATTILSNLGFQTVRNLTGGILSWVEQVDDTLTTY